MDNKKSIFNNKKEAWDITIAVIVILIASLFIYKKVFPDTPTNKEFSVVDKVLSNENTRDLFTSLDNHETVDSGLETPSKTVNSLHVKENHIHNYDDIENLQIETPTIGELSKFDNIEKSHNTDLNPFRKSRNEKPNRHIVTEKDNKQLELEVNSDEVPNAIESDEVIDSKLGKEKTVVDPVEPTSKKIVEPIIATDKNKIIAKESVSSDCVVVVGVFRESLNSNKAKTDIADLGYSHTQGVLKNGLIYIGVPVLCNNKKEKQQIMNTLNTKFNVETWLKKVSN